MLRQTFHRTIPVLAFFLAVGIWAAGSALAAGGQSSSTTGVTVSHGSDGGLVVTLHKDSGSVAFSYELGYMRCNQKHRTPLFAIGNVRGGEGVYGSASGCPYPPVCPPGRKPADYGTVVQCPATGVKSVKIVLENGGTALMGKGDACSPVPVSIEARGDGDHAYLLDAAEECHETVSCPGTFGQVQADAGDTLKANCSDGVTKLVQRQSAP